MSGGGGGGNSPFAWLGLLKWSLAYTDGTSSSSADGSAPPPPMSEEDRAFLELVMTEGIVDEGERMKAILRELTRGLANMLGGDDDADVGGGGGGDRREEEGGEEEGGEEEEEKRMDHPPAPDGGGMLDLLGELRDIVEQIDYARAFSAMGGAPFLLGLATHRHHRPADDDDAGGGGGRGRMRTIVIIPDALRGGALRTLSTMCQNNPPVQSSLLGCDHVTPLVRLFLDRTFTGIGGDGDDDGRGGGWGGGDEDKDGGDDDSVRADVVQALSASARGFPPGELALCDGDGGAAVALMLGLGLGMTATRATTERLEGSPPPSSSSARDGGGDDGARPSGPPASARPPSARLRRRSLFLLRALLTSDYATDERRGRFRDVVDHAITRLIDDAWEADAHVREMGLTMATGLLRHEGVGGAGGGGGGGARASSSKTMILRHRDHIGSVGVRRIRAIRNLEDGSEEKESATLELEEWENLMVALAEAGNERGGGDAPPLAVCDMHVP